MPNFAGSGGGDTCGFRYPVLLNCWFLAAMTVLLAFVAGLSTFANDEALWGYCGWLWSVHGSPPYLGAFENKPVGILLIYRFSWAVFGAAAPVGGLCRLTTAATLLVLYRTASRYQSRIAGAMAAIVFGLFSINRITDGEASVCTEAFMLFCTITAACLITRLYLLPPARGRQLCAFGVGLALGAALGFKQIAVVDVIGLAPLCCVAIRRNSTAPRMLGDVTVIVLGCLAMTTAEYLPLAFSGVSLREYWHSVVGTLFLQQGQQDISHHVMLFVRDWTASPLVICYPLVLAYLFQKRQLQQSGVPFWSLLFWLGSAFLGANASADLWYHQFKQVILPISLVAGLGIDSFVRTLDRAAPRALAWIYLSLIVILFPYESVLVEIGDHVLPRGVPRPGATVETTAVRITKHVQSQTDPADYIFIWHPQGSQQFYGQRRCSSRYFNTRFQFLPDFESRIAADCAAHPPKLILVDESPQAPALPACLRELMSAHYAAACRIDQFAVYRQRP